MTLPARRDRNGEPTNLGRPILLDPDLATTVSSLLRRGMTQTDACDAAGLARSTFYSWISRARTLRDRIATPDTEGPIQPSDLTAEEVQLLDFLDAVTGARARAKGDALGAIRAGMADDWRAAAWFLERSFPAEYGRRDALLVESAESLRVTIRWPDEPEIEDAELVEEYEE